MRACRSLALMVSTVSLMPSAFWHSAVDLALEEHIGGRHEIGPAQPMHRRSLGIGGRAAGGKDRGEAARTGRRHAGARKLQEPASRDRGHRFLLLGDRRFAGPIVGPRGRMTQGAPGGIAERASQPAACPPLWWADSVAPQCEATRAPFGRRGMDIRDGFVGSVGNTPLIKLRRASEDDRVHDPRQGRVSEPRRLGQGPRRALHHQGRRGARAA